MTQAMTTQAKRLGPKARAARAIALAEQHKAELMSNGNAANARDALANAHQRFAEHYYHDAQRWAAIALSHNVGYCHPDALAALE